MNNKQAYEHIVNIIFKYEEKEPLSLDDRKLNNEALNRIRKSLNKQEDLKKRLNYVYSCDYIGSKSKEGIVSDIIDEIDNAMEADNDE